jgi:penicillin-binding protein 1A
MTDILRPIRTDADYQAALAHAAKLLDAPEGSSDSDVLAVLSILIANYERDLRQPADPLETLRLEIQTKGRNQSELADVLGSRSRASEVLSGRRPISASMADKISAAWSVPRSLLGPTAAKSNSHSTIGKGIAASFTGIAVLGAATWAWAMHDLTKVDPLVAQIRNQTVATPLTGIPIHVRQAFLAAEDADFYLHDGQSLRGIARASLQNIAFWQNGHRPAGGTGISEQLVKNTLLKGQPKSLKRRIQQYVLAGQLEKQVSKDQILERYLNLISFGGKTVGVGAASQAYFGTSVQNLTVAQSASLAAMSAAPTRYRLDRPANYPGAKVRRTWVLERMNQEGFLTASATNIAAVAPLP